MWVHGVLSLQVNRPRNEAYHPPPYNAEAKNDGAVLPFSNVSWHSVQLSTKTGILTIMSNFMVIGV
jgi:hypothetical protein